MVLLIKFKIENMKIKYRKWLGLMTSRTWFYIEQPVIVMKM